MADNLNSLRDDATRAMSHLAREIALKSKLGKIVFLAGFAMVSGICQFLASGGKLQSAGVVGVVATIGIFLYAFILILAEDDPALKLDTAQKAIDAAEAARDEAAARVLAVAGYVRMIDRMIALLNAQRSMAALIQQLGNLANLGDDALVAALLNGSNRMLSIAGGFAASDEWTICVYKAVPVEGDCRKELVLVEHARAISCEKNDARRWQEGQGVAGIAYAKRDEVIVANLRDDSIQSLAVLPKDKDRPAADRYRSIVAVPILVAGLAEPWGVVCSTNDKIEHFNHRQETGLKAEEAIRSLASYVGLAISVRQSSVPPSPPVADTDSSAGRPAAAGTPVKRSRWRKTKPAG